jgi:hypothetical protein
VFVLGDDLRVRGWTESTREWFAAPHPDPAHKPDGLPIDAWVAIGRLLSAERGEVDGLPPRALVRGANGGWAVTEPARARETSGHACLQRKEPPTVGLVPSADPPESSEHVRGLSHDHRIY